VFTQHGKLTATLLWQGSRSSDVRVDVARG
jgi:hypothetical protein